MKLINLISRFRNRPVFRLADLYPDKAHKKHELVQLNHWVKQGELVRIMRGMYTLPAGQRRASLDPLWLANEIYSPSYISLEYALSHRLDTVDEKAIAADLQPFLLNPEDIRYLTKKNWARALEQNVRAGIFK